MPLAPKTQFGRYEVRSLLGAGGMGEVYLGQIEQFQKTLELDPNFPTTHYFTGRAYEAKGRYDQAVAEYAIAAKLAGLTQKDIARSNEVYAKSGWKAYLQESLTQILAQPPSRHFPSFVVATYYARLGQNEQALSWLQKGY